MPAAAKLMADNQLAPGSVPGTGRDGRTTKGDVLGAIESGRAGGAPAPAPGAGGGQARRSRRPRRCRRWPRRRRHSASATAPSSACR